MIGVNETASRSVRSFESPRSSLVLNALPLGDGRVGGVSDGKLVTLETILIGGVRHTSTEAYERFLRVCNPTETATAAET